MVPARFVDRPNRFVVIAELADGTRVRAYLPNTGRLTHLTIPGRELVLRRDGKPPRVTEYTLTRAWDGCWVALEASRAPHLLRLWLEAGNPLPGFGRVTDIQTEVTRGKHRIDLVVGTDSGPVWIEVKSGGRADNGVALLSQTPSARGVEHLAALGDIVAGGELAAAAFVIQRPDVHSLRIGGDADSGWVTAVLSARQRGVPILAFGCNVTETEVDVDRTLPIVWPDD